MLTYEVVQDNGDVWEIDAEHVIVANGEVSFINDDGDMVTVLDVEEFSVVDDEECDEDEDEDDGEYEEAVDIDDVEYSEEDGEFVVWSEEDDCYYIVEYDFDVDAYFYVAE